MRHIFTYICVFVSTISFGALIDAEGNNVTNETALYEIDMHASTFWDFIGNISYTNVIKDIATNTVVMGYTPWTYSGNVYDGAQYSIAFEASGDNYIFILNDLKTSTQVSTVTTNILNPTVLNFSAYSGTITASRQEIRRNSLGLAMYSDVQAVDEKIDNMDTSYMRTNVAIEAGSTIAVCPSNANQTVQFVNAPVEVRTLKIQFPVSGMTKDWLVYVLSVTNVAIDLPPANYWCANESVTNDIPGETPTALYFSQINDDTYSLGRQTLVPITIDTPYVLQMKSIQKNMKKTRRLGIWKK